MEIIVISVSKYKDKDAVITAISKDEIITFYARGVFSPTNKNAFLTCVLVKANITLIEGKIAHPILESAQLISSPMMLSASFEYMSAILAIDEAIFHLFEESEKFVVYPILDECISALKSKVDPYHVCLYFFLKILPFIGFGIEVNNCVNCNSKKNIVDFSFVEGGFLCARCAEISERKYSNEQLMLIRNTILANRVEELNKFKSEDSKVILADVNNFIMEGLGYKIKNLDTLLK